MSEGTFTDGAYILIGELQAKNVELEAELEKARKWKERAEKLDKFSKLKIEQLDKAEATIERERKAVKVAVEITVDEAWQKSFWAEYKAALQ